MEENENEKEIIYEEKRFITSKGRMMIMRIPAPIPDGMGHYFSCPPTEFFCVAAMVKTAHTNRGPISQKVPVEVKVEAKSIGEAFEKSSAAVEEFAKGLKQQSNIIQATSVLPFPKHNNLM